MDCFRRHAERHVGHGGWAQVMGEAMENCDLEGGSGQEEWGKLEPLAEPTPANAKNMGAAEEGRWTMRMVGKGATNKDGEEEMGKGLGLEEGRREMDEKDTTKGQAEENWRR